MVTRYPHTLSTQSLFRVLRAAQATPQEPSPGLYARIQPDNACIQYQYYCPRHPDFGCDTLPGCYNLFAHSGTFNTAVRFDMSGSVCPDYSVDPVFDSTIANNFSVLAGFCAQYNLVLLAYEIYLKLPQQKKTPYTNFLLDMAAQILGSCVLSSYLKTPKDSSPFRSCLPQSICQNYTWLAWLSPTPLEQSVAYSANHIVGAFPSSLDPLHRPIPVTKEPYTLQTYTNLFAHTKVVGPTVYRGLDLFWGGRLPFNLVALVC